MTDPIKGTLTLEREAIVEKWTGACNPMTGEQQICASYDNDDAQFTSSDVNNILDGYYRAKGLDDKKFEKLLSQVHPSATPGCICWKSLGGAENKKLAEAIDDTCKSEVLKGSPDADAKCDAFEASVSRLADEPWYVEAGKYVGGIAAIWVVFGPGMSLWNKMSGRGGGGSGPTGGAGGGNGNTYVQVNGDAIFNYNSSPEKVSKPVILLPPAKSVITPEQVTFVGILTLIGAVALSAADKALGLATGTLIMIDGNMLNQMNSFDHAPDEA